MTNTIANTILDQLGAGRFIAMTGASNLLDLGNGLQCKLGRGTTNKATHLRVVLEADDTYTVSFQRVRKVQGVPTVQDISSHDGVYADMLGELFTAETGFYLSL